MRVYGIGGHTYPSMNVAGKQLHVSRRHMTQNSAPEVEAPPLAYLIAVIIVGIGGLIIVGFFLWAVIMLYTGNLSS